MRLLLAFLLALPAFAGYGYSVAVTIDNAQVGGATLTDYPAMVCANGPSSGSCDATAHTNLAIANLKSTGNGGKVTSTSGYDIGLFSDANCTASLSYELEYYSPTTGWLVMWVNISSLSHSVDTVIYLCYENAAITTNQSTTATWASKYLLVGHYPDGTTLSYADSTSNARTGVPNTMSGTPSAPAALAGIADGAASWDTGVDVYALYSGTGLPTGTGSRTISVWYKAPNVCSAASNQYIWMTGSFPTNNQFVGLRTGGTGLFIEAIGINGTAGLSPAFTISCNTWYHFAFTFNSSGTVAKLYANGVEIDSGTFASANTGSASFSVGASGNPAIFNGSCGCYTDEVRFTNSVETTSLLAEYNNVSSPWTFYTFGGETPLGGRIRHRVTQQ